MSTIQVKSFQAWLDGLVDFDKIKINGTIDCSKLTKKRALRIHLGGKGFPGSGIQYLGDWNGFVQKSCLSLLSKPGMMWVFGRLSE